MSLAEDILRHLQRDLDKQRDLRLAAVEESQRERRRLQDIHVFCRLLSSDDNNNALNIIPDELSDLSTIGSSERDSSGLESSRDDTRDDSSLDSLRLEKSLLSAEISHLENDGDGSDDSDDGDDDEELKEFKRIEREIKIQELNKCLKSIENQIESKREADQRVRPNAPLAESESLKSDSPQRTTADDRTTTAETTGDDDRRQRQRRPLTLYCPAPEDEELDLEQHIRELGHELHARSDVHVSPSACCGYLYKLCRKSGNTWRKRYFLFDRKSKSLVYFRKKANQTRDRAPDGGVPFDHIHDVYVDHTRASDTRHVFVVVTLARQYVLASTRAETMRIWVDSVVTGCQEQLFLD